MCVHLHAIVLLALLETLTQNQTLILHGILETNH